MNPHQEWFSQHGYQVLSNILENLKIVYEEPDPNTWQQFWNTSAEHFWWDLVKCSLFSASSFRKTSYGKPICTISGLLEQGEEFPKEGEKIIITLANLVLHKGGASAWVKSVHLER